MKHYQICNFHGIKLPNNMYGHLKSHVLTLFKIRFDKASENNRYDKGASMATGAFRTKGEIRRKMRS